MQPLEVRDLSVRIGSKQILSNISLSVRAGGCTVVLGPNGSGKTTLLRALMGLQNFEGSVMVDGQRLARGSESKHFSWMPQEIPAGNDFSVEQVVFQGIRADSGAYWESAEEVNRAHLAIAEVGLKGFEQTSMGTLSGGERQRAIFARALARLAPILLLDEPAAQQDPKQHETLVQCLGGYREKGRSAVAVVHDLNLAVRIGTDFLLLDSGKTAFWGNEKDLVESKILNQVFGVDFVPVSGPNGQLRLIT